MKTELDTMDASMENLGPPADHKDVQNELKQYASPWTRKAKIYIVSNYEHPDQEVQAERAVVEGHNLLFWKGNDMIAAFTSWSSFKEKS